MEATNLKSKGLKTTLDELTKYNLRTFGQQVLTNDVAYDINEVLGKEHKLYDTEQVYEVACALVYLYSLDKGVVYIDEYDQTNQSDWVDILKAIGHDFGSMNDTKVFVSK